MLLLESTTPMMSLLPCSRRSRRTSTTTGFQPCSLPMTSLRSRFGVAGPQEPRISRRQRPKTASALDHRRSQLLFHSLPVKFHWTMANQLRRLLESSSAQAPMMRSMRDVFWQVVDENST